MDKLLQCRQKIDEIDTKIIELFEARMDVIKDVVAYKLANNMPVLDASREAAMLEKNLKKIRNAEYASYYPNILLAFLSASRKMQEELIDKAQL
jgi:chorismate mutase/prephenate dehydratase